MGKIVKYCAVCEESFAHKFGFCPNCGGALKAFEMSPVQDETKVLEDRAKDASSFSGAPKVVAANKNDAAPTAASANGTSPIVEPSVVAAGTAFFPANGASSGNVKVAKDESPLRAKVISPEPIAKSAVPETSVPQNTPIKISPSAAVKPLAATASAVGNGNGNGHQKRTEKLNFQPVPKTSNAYANDGFRVTVIEEKNVGQRNVLLLGSMLMIMSLALGGLVYSLFSKDMLVGSIDTDSPLYAVLDDVPMEVKDELPKPKIDKDAGGGGGGGREEETPTSKGRLATQMPDPPLITPTKTIPQKDNFELKMQATTQGNKVIKQTEENYGDPNSKYTLSSDGMGRGRGQGSGQGTGQGSGRGTGAGSGLGSGFGGGKGDGDGDGEGSGRQGLGNPPPPAPVKPPAPVGPSVAINIISKPQPKYTDAARTNNIQGTVTLKITFLASGQIGSIAPVSGLPYGLTEQAIAAARQIRFEPPKKNGVPYSVAKTLAYSFSIY